MFTEQEIKFLLRPHVETAAVNGRPLAPSVDLRELGCPQRIFETILESRAKKLGSLVHGVP